MKSRVLRGYLATLPKQTQFINLLDDATLQPATENIHRILKYYNKTVNHTILRTSYGHEITIKQVATKYITLIEKIGNEQTFSYRLSYDNVLMFLAAKRLSMHIRGMQLAKASASQTMTSEQRELLQRSNELFSTISTELASMIESDGSSMLREVSVELEKDVILLQCDKVTVAEIHQTSYNRLYVTSNIVIDGDISALQYDEAKTLAFCILLKDRCEREITELLTLQKRLETIDKLPDLPHSAELSDKIHNLLTSYEPLEYSIVQENVQYTLTVKRELTSFVFSLSLDSTGIFNITIKMSKFKTEDLMMKFCTLLLQIA